jgi:prepilin-type N-terminal cleavage/methylation domain-containing protein
MMFHARRHSTTLCAMAATPGRAPLRGGALRAVVVHQRARATPGPMPDSMPSPVRVLPGNPWRGFTLLEVILAVGVIASIALMVAILWSTLVRWQSDAIDQQERMRLHRVAELLREQWADRRLTRSMMAGGREYQLGEHSLTFVTAVPVLFPDWPLVAVTYSVERSSTSGGQPRYALVYQEQRITDTTSMPVPVERDERGRLLIKRVVLIDGATELAWQRFGRLDSKGEETPPDPLADALSPTGRGEQAEDSDRRPTAGSASSRRDREGAASRTAAQLARDAGWRAQRSTGSVLDELDLHRPGRRTDLDDPEVQRWRPVEPDHRGRLSAVRLVGLAPAVLPPSRPLRFDEKFDERPVPSIPAERPQEFFACVLIVMGSP